MLVRTATALTVATTGTAFAAPSAFAATATVNASCVAPYSLDTNVGVTVIDWSGAPTGAQVKVTGYGTDLRPAPTPSGSVLLPGLPLDKPALEGSPGHQGYQAYLIDAGGAVIAGPAALTLCAPTPPPVTPPGPVVTPPPSSGSCPVWRPVNRIGYKVNGVTARIFTSGGKWYLRVGKGKAKAVVFNNCGRPLAEVQKSLKLKLLNTGANVYVTEVYRGGIVR
jgi:hypothetical protein